MPGSLPGVGNPTERLLEQLDLSPVADSASPRRWTAEIGENGLNLKGRIFGGMIVGQSIVAAGRTFPDRHVHSVQQTFVRSGSPDVPLCYEVVELHTGGTYAAVRVELRQGDTLVAHSQIGLTTGAEGPDRQDPAPTVAPIEQMANRDELRQRPNWQNQPVQMFAEAEAMADGQPDLAAWLRTANDMPDDQLMHCAVLGFASDRGMMPVAWKPHRDERPLNGASLDHSIWFHRPVRIDEWHSHVVHSASIAGGRGINHGLIHHHDGTHVATTMQQGIYR